MRQTRSQSSLPVPPFARSVLGVACLLGGCSQNGAGSPAVTRGAAGGPLENEAQAATIPSAPRPAREPETPQRVVEAVAPSATSAPPSAAVAPPGARIHARARFAWIQAEPHASRGWLGYLGLGGSVALRGGSAEAAKVLHSEGVSGCRAWYAIEPRGFMCDGDAATLDGSDPVVAALAAEAPRTDSPWPYDYGESIGAPRYAHPPTPAEQRHAEWDFAAQADRVARARAGEAVAKEITGVDVAPPAADLRWPESAAPRDWLQVSPLVREGRAWIATGSTVAYTRQIELGGRTFLVSHDHALVPKDRVRPYPRSEFHGVELGAETALPIAFFRKTERPRYRRGDDGVFATTGEAWPRLAWVGLTGDQVKEGSHTFLATREAGVWVRASDAAVARAAEMPAMARISASPRKTWLDVSVLGGTMVAYEGDKPVFATLISPGRGGIPEGDRDPLETASTPTGTFRVDGKFVTATMVSSTNDLLVHTEVQYVQNFHGPHALHAAYWHDGWGEKKSGGCINLAPIDAQRMFAWGEPRMPEGWYGMRSVAEMGPATVVVVHR